MRRHEHAVARRLLGWLVLVLVAALPAELPAAACPVPEASAETMVTAPVSGGVPAQSAAHSCGEMCSQDGSGMGECALACVPGTAVIFAAGVLRARLVAAAERFDLPVTAYRAPPDGIVPPPPRIGG